MHLYYLVRATDNILLSYWCLNLYVLYGLQTRHGEKC